MTNGRKVPTKLLWIMLLGFVSVSCVSEGGQTTERAYANDVLVDTEWMDAHADDSSVRVLEVGGNAEAFGEGHLPAGVLSVDGPIVEPRRSPPRPDRDSGPGVGGHLPRRCRTGSDRGPVRPSKQSFGGQSLLGLEVLPTHRRPHLQRWVLAAGENFPFMADEKVTARRPRTGRGG